jgi:hypothetical protein
VDIDIDVYIDSSPAKEQKRLSIGCYEYDSSSGSFFLVLVSFATTSTVC